MTTRRHFLLAGGATALIAGCGGGSERTTPAAPTGGIEGLDGGGAAASATTLTAADFDALPTCTLTPEAPAGPFPLERQLVRQDITEGRPGHPLRLGLRVVGDDCVPVPGAAVEVWHADSTGDYSAFADGGDGKDEGEGTTFLRGTQVAGDDGIVELLTIFPGWYRGRALHLHLRVHLDGSTLVTGQLYFDAGEAAEILRREPYAEFGPPDTSNDTDGLAGDPARDGTLLRLAPSDTALGDGSLALLNLGVRVP